jgi:hypothetical protein
MQIKYIYIKNNSVLKGVIEKKFFKSSIYDVIIECLKNFLFSMLH